MNKNLPLIILAVGFILTLLVFLRMNVVKDVFANTTAPVTTVTVPHTAPQEAPTVRLTANNGFLVIVSQREILYKAAQIKIGDTPKELKAIFGKYPKGIEDENGDITRLIYYVGLIEIRCEGNPVKSVKVVDTENNNEVLFDSTKSTTVTE